MNENCKSLAQKISELYSLDLVMLMQQRVSALVPFHEMIELLNKGEIRASEKINGKWIVNEWVKKGILVGMRLGILVEATLYPEIPVPQACIATGSGHNFNNRPMRGLAFVDKDTYPLKKMDKADRVRIVPGGTSVRNGCYLAPKVTVMPPSYINVGAFVGEESMVDSLVLIGSCAQIGIKVHLSAGVIIGGVLDPVGLLPVVVEDHAFVGGQSGIYEGTIVEEYAVIGSGVILNGSTKVYDLVNGKVLCRTEKSPLVIPSRAVVIPGCRPAGGDFASEHNIMVSTPVIVKYRDKDTDPKLVLEDALRNF